MRPARRRRLVDLVRLVARPALPPPPRVRGDRAAAPGPARDDRDPARRLELRDQDGVHVRAARRRHADDAQPRRLPDRGAARRAHPRSSQRFRPLRRACSIERSPMSTSVLYMSMSLDGFIAGPDDGPGQGLGAGGEVLHGWLGDGVGGPSTFRPAGPERRDLRRVLGDRSRARRAAHVRHRRPLERRPPRRRSDLRPDPGRAAGAESPTGSTTSPTASRARWRQAKAAAGDANVMVHGAALAQSLLRAGCSTRSRST